MVTTLPQDDTRLDLDNGNHDRFSHYVPKADLMTAFVEGLPIIALCGKVWVPSRDPDKYPVCPDCKRIYEEELDA